MSRGLVIFDCDGVLVDSEPVANQILAAMVSELGWPMDTDGSMQTFMGRTLPSCVEIIERELGRAVPGDFIAELERRTFEAFDRDLRAVVGVEQAIDAVDEMGLERCVASSGSVAKMRRTLALTGLLPRFEDRLYSGVDVARGKPHPDVFLHAAKACGVAPEDCVVVEDSVLGVEGARAARMVVLGFARDVSPDALIGAGAAVFRDMAELPDMIRELLAERDGRDPRR